MKGMFCIRGLPTFFPAAIRCSAIPLRKNMAMRNGDFASYNGDGVTYICKAGFSFNASVVNDTTRTAHCEAHGLIEHLNPPDCKRKYLSTHYSCVCLNPGILVSKFSQYKHQCNFFYNLSEKSSRFPMHLLVKNKAGVIVCGPKKTQRHGQY